MNSRFIVLYVGRLHPDKNVSFLIDAFKTFHNMFADTVLWIIGEGYLKNSLMELAKKNKLSNAIEFFGFVPNQELVKYYQQASVFVMPSTDETFGIAAVEAMHFSKPIIVPDALVSATDLVAHGINGFIFDSTTVADLISHLALLKEDPDLVRSMGQESLKRTANFNVENAMNVLEDCYKSLVYGEKIEKEQSVFTELDRQKDSLQA